MNAPLQLARSRILALAFTAGASVLGGCTTTVRPLVVDEQHPANPLAPSSTPAPLNFPLLAPVSSSPKSEAKPANAGEDAPASIHHHHDS